MPIHSISKVNNTNNINIRYQTLINVNDGNLPTYLVHDADDFSKVYLNTQAVTLYLNNDSRIAFGSLPELENLNVPGFNFRYTTSISGMFQEDANLQSITDIDNWNISKVKNFSDLFYNCRSLLYDISNWNISNGSHMSAMFYGAKLPSGMFNMNRSNCNMQSMFAKCADGAVVMQDWNLKNCDCSSIFNQVPSVNLYNWNINNTDLSDFVQNNTQSLVLEDFNAVNCYISTNDNSLSLTSFRMENVTWNNCTVINFLRNATDITNISINNWTLANPKNLYKSFHNCANLRYVNMYNCNILNFNQGNMLSKDASMFKGCPNLISVTINNINIDNFNTDIGFSSNHYSFQTFNVTGNISNVISANYMFAHCHDLVDVNIFCQTNNIMDLHGMFSMFDENNTHLTSINMPNINFGQNGNANSMFWMCTKLRHLNVTGWNTEKVSDFNRLFHHCYNLQSLDLSGWSTASVTSAYHMFFLHSCNNLSKVWVSNGIVGVPNNGQHPFTWNKNGVSCDVYLEGNRSSHNFGSIGTGWSMHYDASYEDFLRA